MKIVPSEHEAKKKHEEKILDNQWNIKKEDDFSETRDEWETDEMIFSWARSERKESDFFWKNLIESFFSI
jgi:hypothetical protein